MSKDDDKIRHSLGNPSVCIGEAKKEDHGEVPGPTVRSHHACMRASLFFTLLSP